MGNMMVAREDRMTEIEGGFSLETFEHILQVSFEVKIPLIWG